MAALRRAVQRGEPLDAQAMMLLEMFSPTAARAAKPARSPRTVARSRHDVRENPLRDNRARVAVRADSPAPRRASPDWMTLTSEQVS